METIFHLGTCSTCQRILKSLPAHQLALKDIKKEAITPEELEEMKRLAGNFESLFSKRSMKYRAMGLHEKELSEEEMKDLILKEYTFLKRPVAVIKDKIFVGNSKKTTEALIQTLS
jgi:arsenate reductase